MGSFFFFPFELSTNTQATVRPKSNVKTGREDRGGQKKMDTLQGKVF